MSSKEKMTTVETMNDEDNVTDMSANPTPRFELNVTARSARKKHDDVTDIEPDMDLSID